MALTAFPAVKFNSATGSDTLASGAGPSTAITCLVNGAVTNSTTIVVDNASADLDTIAEDGSAVLFITGVGFVRIDTVDNATLTIVVETAVTISDNVQLAIGGKRATLTDTESRRLFGATSSPTAVGAQGRWEIVLEDNQSLSGATFNLAMTSGTGSVIIRSDSTTVRSITQTVNATTCFTANTANFVEWRYIKFLHSALTTNKQAAIDYTASAGHVFKNCIFGDSGGTNVPKHGLRRSTSSPTVLCLNCAFLKTYNDGVTGSSFPFTAVGCLFSGCGVSGSSGSACGGGFNPTLIGCIVARSFGAGVASMTSAGGYFENCVFDNNGGDGIACAGNNVRQAIVLRNNIFSNNSGYGVNLSGTTPHYPLETNNLYYNNNGGGTGLDVNGFTVDSTSITGTNPNFVNNADGTWNYATTGTAARAVGFPGSSATMGAGQSGTTNYVDIGIQQQGASLKSHTGMNGGVNG